MTTTNEPAAVEPAKPALPPIPITIGIIVVCVAITGLLNWPEHAAKVDPIVAPHVLEVWRGRVWGLLTSAFTHLAIWHLVFNMWWTRDFGRLLEPRLGPAKYLAFIGGAAVVSSGWQIIVSNETGIGFSGVVYAFFGYVLARRKSEPIFAAFLTRQTIGWMLGWLFLCIALTMMKIWTVGNGAHVAGLVFGFSIGTATSNPKLRPLALASLAVLAIGTVLSTTWLPWSEAWKTRHESEKAYEIALKARQGDPKAMAQIGMHLVRRADRREEGLKLLERAANLDEPNAMNALAWTRATCTDAKVRNAGEAVRWAEKAAQQMPNDAAVVDTLAAAYAEAGRWDEALATQKKAISLLPADASESSRQSLANHLASIERREPIREAD